MIVASSIISAAVAWWIAPHLRARFWRSEGEHSFIKWAGGGNESGDWGHEHTFSRNSKRLLTGALRRWICRYCSSVKGFGDQVLTASLT